MKRQLTITRDQIIESEIVATRSMSHGMGAAVYFTGVVRATKEGAPIKAIEYEAFEKMVQHQFNLLFDEIEKRWPIETVRLVHRIGVVDVNEPSRSEEHTSELQSHHYITYAVF